MLVVVFAISSGPDTGISGIRQSKAILSQAQCQDAMLRAETPPELKRMAKGSGGELKQVTHYCLPIPRMPPVRVASP